MGDDSLEGADLLSVHLVVSTRRQDPTLVHERLHSLLQEAYHPGLVLQALNRHQRELERGMRSDEQTQLGTWTTRAEQLPLWSGDGDIEMLWTRSDGPPWHNFVCVKVRLKAALVLLVQQQQHDVNRQTQTTGSTLKQAEHCLCALRRSYGFLDPPWNTKLSTVCVLCAGSCSQQTTGFSLLHTRCLNTCRSSLITASTVCQSREATTATHC